MRYQVPQFIESETKLVGPFTAKQFLFIATGAVTIYMLNFVLNGVFFIIAAIFIGVLALAFAFAKPEGMPFYRYIGVALSFLLGERKYFYTNQPGSEQVEKLISPEEAAKAEQDQQTTAAQKESAKVLEQYQKQ